MTNPVTPFSIPGRCEHPNIIRIAGHGDSIQFESRRPVTFAKSPGPHLLAIQTCPRPRGNSLDRTLSSLRDAGLGRWEGPKLIVADGYSPRVPAGWILETNPSAPGGSSRTFMRLLRASLNVAPTLERITYLQDDVCLAKNALDYVDQVKIDDDLSFISWFSIWDNWQGQGRDPLPLLEIGKNTKFHGNQALTMPRRTVEIMLRFLESGSWPYRSGTDRIFAVALEDGLFASHYPVIAQHTEGTNSACTPDCRSERKSRQFVGEQFDAMDPIESQKP